MGVKLPERIVVLGKDNKFLSHTHPARIRKMLKSGKAEVFSTKPFAVKLKGERGKVMKPMITNFTKYFSGEEKDIYVQNVSNTNVSLQFEVGPGRYESLPIPRTRRPFNLTQHIPFEAIKRSTDLRKLVNRRPPALQLLSQEEFDKYYEDLAKAMQTSVEEEIDKSMEIQTALMNRQVPKSEMTEVPKTIDDLQNQRNDDPDEAAEEQPLPRVIGLCSEVGPDVAKEAKTSAGDMMAELEALESELRPTDYEYIASRGNYNSIKKWAAARLEGVSEE